MCIVFLFFCFFFNEKIPLKPGIPFRDLFIETYWYVIPSLLTSDPLPCIEWNGHW